MPSCTHLDQVQVLAPGEDWSWRYEDRLMFRLGPA